MVDNLEKAYKQIKVKSQKIIVKTLAENAIIKKNDVVDNTHDEVLNKSEEAKSSMSRTSENLKALVKGKFADSINKALEDQKKVLDHLSK